MVSLLLAFGILIALFVGFNIGGSSTSVAFGPAVGSNTISKVGAAALMTAFALLGGATVGRNVITTLSEGLVPEGTFTVGIGIIVLFFIGVALFLSNVVGVPASTSMTAVGAIAGLGLATNSLNWGEMGRIITWWLVSPLIAFWSAASSAGTSTRGWSRSSPSRRPKGHSSDWTARRGSRG